MKYSCIHCNYETNRKPDITRHTKTKSHLQKVDQVEIESKLNPKHIQHESNKFLCTYCQNTYSTQSNLSKHMKKCTKKIIAEKDNLIKNTEMIILKEKLYILEKELNSKDKQIHTYERMLQSLTTPQTINYYNYISSTYPNPTLLDSKKSYVNLLEAKTMTLIEVIVMYYSNGKLANFIGDYIIKNYKKKEPKDQAMWGTDVSRLNFIISESCKDNTNIWSYDKKAVKIKKIVIEPALQYIKSELYEFCQENSMMTDESKLNQLKVSVEIMTIINNGSLANDIIKYIAPEFAIVMTNDQPMIKI